MFPASAFASARCVSEGVQLRLAADHEAYEAYVAFWQIVIRIGMYPQITKWHF